MSTAEKIEAATEQTQPTLGVELIAAERRRQVEEEGWTPEHDDEHAKGELALAGAVYAWPSPTPLFVKKAWPWAKEWFKPWPSEMPATPSDEELRAARIRRLTKAGALIAAEIDRLTRKGSTD